MQFVIFLTIQLILFSHDNSSYIHIPLLHKDYDIMARKHFYHYWPLLIRSHWPLLDFTHKRPPLCKFDIFFGFSLNKILNKYTQLPMICNSHYGDVIMDAIASQITILTIVYSTVYSDADQRKHHSSASLAFVWGIHRWPVNSPHKWPVTWEMFPFGDVIMAWGSCEAAVM